MTRSQCKVSDTQVTVKACGPLVLVSRLRSKAFCAKNNIKPKVSNLDDLSKNIMAMRYLFKSVAIIIRV